MEFENEKKNEEQSAEQQNTGNQESGYQGYRPGRSPRPRIHQPRPYTDQSSYSRNQNQEEGGFRPEGFGAGLQSGAPQSREYQPRGGYRPRNNYNGQEGGYRPRPQYGQQGGYQPRQSQGEYGQPRNGYRPRYNQQEGEGGYQPRSGYQPRGGYGQPRQQGGYQSRGGYGQQQGGYRPRPQYGQQGGYGQQRQGGYAPQRGGFKPKRGAYDPNAKYSLKTRIEYKEENYDPNEPIRLNKFLAKAGVCSRREADEFIQAGVVTVNGEVVTELGSKVLRTDEVKFHDAPVTPEKKVYV